MMEAILIPVAIEVVLFALAGAVAIPGIKKELARLNNTLEKINETQAALVETVIRDNERLDNHINDKHAHGR